MRITFIVLGYCSYLIILKDMLLTYLLALIKANWLGIKFHNL